jgi:hypothetical protein
MKLVLCKKCQDVVRLTSEMRQCKCKLSGGCYLDDIQAVYWGNDAAPLGFDNLTLVDALKRQPEGPGVGATFVAFVIPRTCDTFKRVKPPNIIPN